MQLLFRVAIAYARYVYLIEDEFDIDTKKRSFEDLYEYWQENRKANNILKDSQFYLDTARMLMWFSHFKWKFEKKYIHAKEMLERSLNGLAKVKHCDVALKEIINCSIETLAKEVKRVSQKLPRKLTQRQFCPEEWQRNGKTELKKPISKAKAITTNLLDMINSVDDSQASNNQGIKFQIHDDELPSTSSVSTPAVKKSTRARNNKDLETPIQTPSTRQKQKSNDQIQKTSEKSKRDFTSKEIIDLTELEITSTTKRKDTEKVKRNRAKKSDPASMESFKVEVIPPTPSPTEIKVTEKLKRTRAKKNDSAPIESIESDVIPPSPTEAKDTIKVKRTRARK